MELKSTGQFLINDHIRNNKVLIVCTTLKHKCKSFSIGKSDSSYNIALKFIAEEKTLIIKILQEKA